MKTYFLETIKNARFEAFLSARNVTGGGQQNGVYLGKVVRWYMSNEPGLEPLKYVKNGNKVPKTDGAKACMVIDKTGAIPQDLDYEWYLLESVVIAYNCGCHKWLDPDMVARAFKSRGKKVPKC